LLAHGTFSKIDHILGHKTSLNKYKKNEIISSILSDHNRIKLESNTKRDNRNYTNTWRSSNMLLNEQWVIEDTRRKFKNS
jgi:hypothetical protein